MNDDQRRSTTSKYAIIGDSTIPSALGQTVTGALANIPFPFGIDPDTGEYGYRKAGADAVTPFKSDLQYIGTIIPTYGQYVDYSCTSVPGWQNLTVDSFVFCIPMKVQGAPNTFVTGAIRGGNANNTFSGGGIQDRSYDSSTGVLHFYPVSATFHNSNGYAYNIAYYTELYYQP